MAKEAKSNIPQNKRI